MPITGMHAIMRSVRAEATRELLRDIMEWPSVDAGHGLGPRHPLAILVER